MHVSEESVNYMRGNLDMKRKSVFIGYFIVASFGGHRMNEEKYFFQHSMYHMH